MQLLGHRRLQLRRLQRSVARASQVGPRSFQGDLGARLHRVKGDACSTEWNWCISGSQDCVCVFKPGTLQTADTVWDCANPWF